MTTAKTAALVRIELPFPPSVWEIYAGWGKTRHRSEVYNKWLRDAGYFIRCRNQEPVSVPFSASIALRRPSKRSDLDNRAKAILDCLQHYRVIKNDNLCERLSMTWDAGLSAECVVIIQEAQEGVAA